MCCGGSKSNKKLQVNCEKSKWNFESGHDKPEGHEICLNFKYGRKIFKNIVKFRYGKYKELYSRAKSIFSFKEFRIGKDKKINAGNNEESNGK